MVAYLVPGLFTRGSTTHCSPPAHDESTNLPPMHCPSLPFTHAWSPALHGEAGVRLWNFLLSACASLPFCSVNAARLSTTTPAETAAMRETGNKTWVKKSMMVRLDVVEEKKKDWIGDATLRRDVNEELSWGKE